MKFHLETYSSIRLAINRKTDSFVDQVWVGLCIIPACVALAWLALSGMFLCACFALPFVLNLLWETWLLSNPVVRIAVVVLGYTINLIFTIIAMVHVRKMWVRGVIDVEAIVLSIGLITAFLLAGVVCYGWQSQAMP